MSKYYVGTYTEKDLKDGKDKKDVEKAIKKTGFKYVQTKINKKEKTLSVWVSEDFEV